MRCQLLACVREENAWAVVRLPQRSALESRLSECGIWVLRAYPVTIAFWGICVLLSEKRIFEILELCSSKNRFSFQFS